MNQKIITGIIDRNKKGFGFVIPVDTNIDDIYIPQESMVNIFDGDMVEVIIRKKKNNKFSDRGVISKILKRAHKYIIGRIIREKKNYIFLPINEKIYSALPVIKNHFLNNYNPDNNNKLYKCEILNYNVKPVCRINKEFDTMDSAELEKDIIFTQFNYKSEFSESLNKELDSIKFLKNEKDLEKRKDYRNLLTITIDPETAKDFDDAVSLEIRDGKYILYVHIADVSYYIKEGSNIDKEAYSRGTSVYLIDKVIPMLPEKLSNDLCSLKSDVDRLAISVKAIFNREGKLEKNKICKSIIKVNKRFNYKEVDRIIDSDYKGTGPNALSVMIKNMVELSQKLRKHRLNEGSVDFDLPEPVFELDNDGNLLKTEIENRTLSHELIEEFMLIANEIIARYLSKLKLNILYRIHEQPDINKMLKLSGILTNYYIKFKNKNCVESKELQNILKKIKGKEEERFLTTLILRSMQQARYSPENKGHFGLAKKYYTHFTSPIRRYPDLIVHRTLSDVLNGRKIKKYSDKKYFERLKEVGQYLSKVERIAVEAERKSIRLRLMQHLKNNINEVYDGYISGFISNGIFVELENSLEGFINLQDRKKDYLIDVENYELRIQNKIYKLGQKIKIKILNIDVINNKVDFGLDEK